MPEEDGSTTTATEATNEDQTTRTDDSGAAKGETKSPDDTAVAAAEKPDAVKNAIRRHQEDARKERRRAEAAEAKAKEFEDRDKTAQEKAESRAAEAEEKASKAEAKLLRMEVAGAKDLPITLASRLQGASKAELEADADKLLEEMRPPAETNFDAGARENATAETDMDSMIRRAAGRQ